MKKRILIVGGTSGLGCALGRIYLREGHTVCVTGRRDPQVPGLGFEPLDVGAGTEALGAELDRVVAAFPGVNTLVYAAGFRQRGLIDTLSDAGLAQMVNLGLLVPMMLVQRLKRVGPGPLKVMLITSSSAYVPRAHEPAYTAVKAGMEMLGASLVRDDGIGKVLVAAPSGMQTAFWDGSDQDTSEMLDPVWVADQIVDLSGRAFKYKSARILRQPARVEVVQCLDNEMRDIPA